MESKLLRDLFMGFIRVHILHHASKESIYGAEFHKELQHHGYNISFGTLYPIFHKMETEGLLKMEKILVGGKYRKYYSITESGKLMLSEAVLKVAELSAELNE
jgi:PadR family transcriptional regulator, regulatory protein PadR